MTMFKSFAAPPWTDLGPNLLIISIVLLLVGFWSIGIATSDEVLSEYTRCSYHEPPLVNNGRWYDRTPCLDKKTDGVPGWHPFVSMVFSLCFICLSLARSRVCSLSLALPPLPFLLFSSLAPSRSPFLLSLPPLKADARLTVYVSVSTLVCMSP